uniref:ANK_REP_REGION domain-containing protein n=1 Tax=Parastrongyloides trichosuri TaxID=131310 RepID=A0A0N5A4Z9_PARTI
MEYGTAGLRDSVLKAIASKQKGQNNDIDCDKNMSNCCEKSSTEELFTYDALSRAKMNLNQITTISKRLAVKSQKMSYEEFQAIPIKYLKMIKDEDVEGLQNDLKENENHINGIYLLNNSYTLLHYAILYRREKVLKILIELGADVNSQSNMGYSPLHLASRNQDYDMIDVLINSYNADRYILDAEGMSYADRLFMAELNNSSKHDQSHAKYREVFKDFIIPIKAETTTKKNVPILPIKNIKNRSVSQENKIKKDFESTGSFRRKVFFQGLNKIMGSAANRVRHRSSK